MKALGLCLMCLIFQARAEYIEITDSNGKIKFREVPERVVVLNWTLAEQVLALGVVPVGMADVAGYQSQVAQPDIGPNVVDVGSRLSPDLDTIKSLQPDLIVIGYSQRPLIRTLSHISTVLYFKNFSRRHHNANKADERLFELAKLFKQNDRAHALIARRDAQFQRNLSSIDLKFAQNKPTVNVLVIDEPDSAWVFGANSMPQYAIEALGLEPAIVTEPSQFGVTQMSLDELASINGCFLYLSHVGFDPSQSPVWQQTQAAQSDCLLPLETVALYGGSVSLHHLSNRITEALLSERAAE